MFNAKVNGSSLITSLIFLNLMFCVFLLFYETNIYQFKQYAAAKRQFFLNKIAEDNLKEIENKLLTGTLRESSGESQMEEFKITYHLDLLGIYPCVLIENKMAAFFKVDVLAVNSLQEKVHLSSTVAYPSNEVATCTDGKQIISAGRQSWYQFE